MAVDGSQNPKEECAACRVMRQEGKYSEEQIEQQHSLMEQLDKNKEQMSDVLRRYSRTVPHGWPLIRQ